MSGLVIFHLSERESARAMPFARVARSTEREKTLFGDTWSIDCKRSKSKSNSEGEGNCRSQMCKQGVKRVDCFVFFPSIRMFEVRNVVALGYQGIYRLMFIKKKSVGRRCRGSSEN